MHNIHRMLNMLEGLTEAGVLPDINMHSYSNPIQKNMIKDNFVYFYIGADVIIKDISGWKPNKVTAEPTENGRGSRIFVELKPAFNKEDLGEELYKTIYPQNKKTIELVSDILSPDNIKAAYRDGLLIITKKDEIQQKKEIPIS